MSQIALPKGLAAPARCALAAAGIADLNQLTAHAETAIAKLHGIGPNALKTLKQALAENKLKFKAS